MGVLVSSDITCVVMTMMPPPYCTQHHAATIEEARQPLIMLPEAEKSPLKTFEYYGTHGHCSPCWVAGTGWKFMQIQLETTWVLTTEGATGGTPGTTVEESCGTPASPMMSPILQMCSSLGGDTAHESVDVHNPFPP